MEQSSLTVAQALIIALWIALVESRAMGYASLNPRFSPLMTGLVVGVVMGDISTAMVITATIQLIYMGSIAPGGAMPSEPAVATAIAVPVAILGGLKPSEAIAIAVPVGLLGSYLYQLRFFFNTFIVRLTDKYAEELNDRGLTFSIIILPTMISFLLFVPAMFIALYYGAPVIADFTSSLSGGMIFHILDVVGGGLAALGIALIIKVIGKVQFLPFFLLAYFMAVMLKPLEINTVTYAIVGAIIAYLYVLVGSGNTVKE
ncbi:PTS mannose/fructose/sorbose/N-acetylgalactosamine transporter subunit IIC [Garciella nitratireducens]|uniref:PTS mannose/fructose/sorbose/N-acetylgalactosamine transporter subunit IIC n=1 Tax=Garciella nitratireducens TaxID=218205 RepID=UPI001BD3E901|nr:PTS sugar transporter subunit IIC [Garciella nitratireducens]